MNACDDTKYQDGIIEGERLGLEEGMLRFFGSGTVFRNGRNGHHYFISHRYNSEGELRVTRVVIDEQKCLSRGIIVTRDTRSFVLEDGCVNGEDADGLVDNIEIFDPDKETEVFERARDIYAHEDIFLSADKMMEEETRRFSNYPDNSMPL